MGYLPKRLKADGAGVNCSPGEPSPDYPREITLPPLDKNGFLPPGLHDTTLRELEERFTGTPIRKIYWQRLLAFLREIRESDGFSHLYIGGDFLSSASSPSDIDVILQTRSAFGPEALGAMEPLFALGLDTIYRKYGIRLHFWCEDVPADISHARDFFQDIGLGSFSSEASEESKPGIVRVAV